MSIANEQSPAGDSDNPKLRSDYGPIQLDGHDDTETVIPHSGVHFDDRPVVEFDKTSLEEADRQGLISEVPETIEQLVSSEPQSEIGLDTSNRSKLKIAVGAGTAALLLVGGGFLASRNGHNNNVRKAPTATATDKTAQNQQDKAFYDSVAQQNAKDQQGTAEVANAKPRFSLVDAQNPDFPSFQNVKDIFWDLEIGMIKGDTSFLKAGLGDEMYQEPITSFYLDNIQTLNLKKKANTIDTSNYEYGVSKDVADPIVRDPTLPNVFTVELFSRFFNDTRTQQMRVVLKKSFSQEAHAETWSLSTIENP